MEVLLSILIEIEDKLSNLILVSEIFVVRFVLIVKMVRSSFYWEIMFESLMFERPRAVAEDELSITFEGSMEFITSELVLL